MEKVIPIYWKETRNVNFDDYRYSYSILVSPFSKAIQDIECKKLGVDVIEINEKILLDNTSKVTPISPTYYPGLENKTGTRLDLRG